jgi:predicted DCC family thiol-disulfide oxidoreductase YuxK
MNNDNYEPQINIVFFDGYCNLCSALVSLLLKADKHRTLFFSAIQSDFATLFLKKHNLGKDSVVLLFKGKIYTKSTAILKILTSLGIIWKLFYAGYVFPRLLRDFIYEFISKHRYKWFGERSSCYQPKSMFSKRFIYK